MGQLPIVSGPKQLATRLHLRCPSIPESLIAHQVCEVAAWLWEENFSFWRSPVICLPVNVSQLERIIIKAVYEVWPRLLQTLWVSCATDWVECYPSHVVAKWLGHSPKVAAEHCLMSRDHHFEDIVNGSVSHALPGQQRDRDIGQGGVDVCDANCDFAGSRI